MFIPRVTTRFRIKNYSFFQVRYINVYGLLQWIWQYYGLEMVWRASPGTLSAPSRLPKFKKRIYFLIEECNVFLVVDWIKIFSKINSFRLEFPFHCRWHFVRRIGDIPMLTYSVCVHAVGGFYADLHTLWHLIEPIRCWDRKRVLKSKVSSIFFGNSNENSNGRNLRHNG